MEEFWGHYLELLRDPAHLLYEITLLVVIDVVVLGLAWPLFKRLLRREHAAFDAQHNIKHDTDKEK